ncbi:5-formyltetrahydrofolate cyclo-ligase [Staphylococcus canis]|uniref:5-formyltetrahydrofolate cyclo-ligase n=1 Tax=Staphylococcus canis TaxID=2724942 RepID=A0ABS0TA77_9STAP|nr:5-formyltetrahydrofolate cyclo-ligase [Staphylococcus canis]MBI5975653.1 5-formyltetrahydrofolate cyclo-ligase [Staphylococcus canis]
MDKKEIRSETINKMKRMNKSTKKLSDKWLFEQLIQHPKFKESNSIGIVLSMPHEVETDKIIKKALDLGKKIYVPSTNYQHRTMNFQQLFNLNQVDTDEKGIRFVNEETSINNELDLVIVPGVAFDTKGYRIGYGGGYFDRYLSQHNPKTISLVYDLQVYEHLPTESHDRPISELIIADTNKID